MPLAVLVPLALGIRREAVRGLLVAAILWIGPVMGFCVPWRSIVDGGRSEGQTLRIFSCNTQGSSFDPRALGDLIEQVRPDVVALQEWSNLHRLEVFRGPDWSIRVDGGLCLASRLPIRSTGPVGRELLGSSGYVVRYQLDGPDGAMDLVNLHLETPRDGLEAVRDGGLDGAPALRANNVFRRQVSTIAVELIRKHGTPDVIVGDFNLTADSTIFRDFWSSPYRDAFSVAGLGFGYTKYTEWFGADRPRPGRSGMVARPVRARPRCRFRPPSPRRRSGQDWRPRTATGRAAVRSIASDGNPSREWSAPVREGGRHPLARPPESFLQAEQGGIRGRWGLQPRAERS